MAVIILTTGVPGCGKTYVRAARYLVDDFLINTDGLHISNFPLNVDEIAEAVAEKRNRFSFFGRKGQKVTVQQIKDRIKIIPDDVLQSWRRQESGPWDFFDGVDLKYAHIAIDEIHNFVSPSKIQEYVEKWDEFLGEVRHRGCTFEGLTQDIDQVDRVFIGRAAVRMELIPAEDLRDPFFKIKMSDWYELKASLTGHYHKTVWMFEKRKQGRSWRTNNTSRFLITPDYFRFYRSYEASLAEKESLGEGADSDDRALTYEYQRRSRLSLFWWFLSRNWLTLSWRIALAIFVFWLCFCGGLTYFINSWLSVAGKMAKSQKIEAPASKGVHGVPTDSKSNSKKKGQGDILEKYEGVPKDAKELELRKLYKAEVEDIYKPAMFFDGFCWLRNGIKISKDYKFKGGVYDGKTVKEINQQDRYYKLDDDTSVYMY